MKLRRCLHGLPIALGLLALQAPAFAQDAGELKRARAQFQQATELGRAGNWTAALQAFREVGQVRMTPQVRFHIAVCEENLGRLVTALGGYELALLEADKVGPDFAAEVEQNVVKLRARVPKLVLERGTGAEAAAIALDGVALGDSSLGVEVPLDPGPHAVTASAPNRKPFEVTVSLAERETTRLRLELEELPRAPLAGTQPAPLREKPPSKVVPFVIGGLGVAALVGSGVLLGLRQSALSELEAACDGNTCPKSKESRYADLKFYHYGSFVTLAVGVAAVGTAGALLVLQRKKPAAASSRARLELLPALPLSRSEPLGASLRGSF